MKLLLDTHTAIWFYQDAPELSASAKTALETAGNEIHVSVATFWEMAIKIGIGKLKINTDLAIFANELASNGIQFLPVEMSHILHYQSLPLIHRDPFDRMIIAQSLEESMYIVTTDSIVDAYLRGSPVSRIW